MQSGNIYEGLLSFRGVWREYQARILREADLYLEDKRIHIVAAPGAGKRTLGIELIRRSGRPLPDSFAEDYHTSAVAGADL